MKNKTLLSGIIGIMLVCGTFSVNAQEGFTGPGPESGLVITTISEANRLPDDSPVLLRGRIIKSLNRQNTKLKFRDNTGEVVVKIERHIWNGVSVNDNDTVDIFGYTDRKAGELKEIKVRTIKKL
jgi:uncharacterized protein (TIGR00156 family)